MKKFLSFYNLLALALCLFSAFQVYINLQKINTNTTESEKQTFKIETGEQRYLIYNEKKCLGVLDKQFLDNNYSKALILRVFLHLNIKNKNYLFTSTLNTSFNSLEQLNRLTVDASLDDLVLNANSSTVNPIELSIDFKNKDKSIYTNKLSLPGPIILKKESKYFYSLKSKLPKMNLQFLQILPQFDISKFELVKTNADSSGCSDKDKDYIMVDSLLQKLSPLINSPLAKVIK